MTVNTNKDALTPTTLQEKILPSRLKTLYGRINYLYEQLLGELAPSKTGVPEYGHDHSWRRGGVIIPRFRQISFLRPFGVEISPKFYTLEPQKTQRLTFPYHSTQGIIGEGEARLCLRVTPSKKIQIRESNYPFWTEVQGQDPEAFAWIAMPIRQPQNRIIFEFQSLEDSNIEMRIMGIVVTEKSEQVNQRGTILPNTARQTEINNTRFEILNDSFISEDGSTHYWLDAHSLSIAANTLNALYELTFDQASPINSSQVVKGHDHAERGGALVARGGIYSVETDAEDAPLYSRSFSGGTWASVSSSRTNHAYPYVSKGVNSGISPFETTPALEVFLRVKRPNDAEFQFRVVNNTVSKTSQPVIVGTTSALEQVVFVRIPNVPCEEGLNLLSVQARYTGGSPQLLEVLSIEVYERDGVCRGGGTSSP